MRFVDRRLERRLRRAIRRKIGASAELRKRERDARKDLWHRSIRVSFGWTIPLLFLLPAAVITADPDRVEVSLAMTALLAAACACFLAARFEGRLRASPHNVVLGHLPVPDAEIFRAHVGAFLRESVWLVLGPALYFPLAASALELEGGAWRAAVALGVLQGAAIVAFAAALAAFAPPRRIRFAGLAAAAMIVPCLLYGEVLEPSLASWNGIHLVLLPATWGSFAFRNGLAQGSPAGWVGAAACAAFLPALPFALRALRRGFRLADVPPFSYSVAEASLDYMLQHAPPEVRRELPEQMASWVGTRQFLHPIGRPRLLERVFFRSLTPRERDVAALLLPDPPRWSARWVLSLLLSIAAAGVLFAGKAGGTFGLLVALAPILPMLGGRFPGFELRPCGVGWMPMHATLPVAYGECVRVLWKAALVRVAAAVPLLALVGAAAGSRMLGSPGAGALVALKLAALLVAAQPMVAASRFMAGSEEAMAVRLSSLGRMMLMMTLGLVFLAGGMAACVPDAVVAAAGLAAALAASVAFSALVGAVLRRGAVDWGRMAPPE